jgi:outer membrane protein assembly factor BamD
LSQGSRPYNFGLLRASSERLEASQPRRAEQTMRPSTSSSLPGLGAARRLAARRVAAVAAATLVATSLVAACGTTPDVEPNTAESIEALYRSAREEADSGNTEKAIKLYERLEGRATGTVLAQQALLEQAYLQHKSGERALASTVVERFIKLNPSSPALDYAMYLRGVINFNENLGVLSSIARQDPSERDQQASRDAYQAFKQLVDQFPKSKYADDARVRMDYIVNTIAANEVHVARYYFRRGAYLAAANRAQQAVAEYPQVPAAEEALYIMAQSYDKLGLESLRDDARRVLAKNFPDSKLPTSGVRGRERAWWQFW